MKRRGFTLIELIIVVTIIAILATVIMISYGNAAKKSRDSQRKTDLNSIASAMAVYYTEKKSFYGIDIRELKSDNILVTNGYLPQFIQDPNKTSYYGIFRIGTQEAAVYAKMEVDTSGGQCYPDPASKGCAPPTTALLGSYNYGIKVTP